MINREKYQFVLQNLPDGVSAAEVYEGSSKSFEVNVRDGEIDNYDVSSISGLSLRVDCGQIGYAYTEAPDEDPAKLLDKAKENASFVESEDAAYMRFFEGSESYPKLEKIDERLIQAKPEEKIELAFALENKIKALDERIIKLENCSISTAIAETRIFNSLGLNVSMQNGYAFAYAAPIAKGGDEFRNGMAYDIARSLEDLDLDRVAREAVEDAVSQFGGKSVPSGTYNVLVKNRAMSSLLSAFSSLFNAEAAQKGLSLLAGKEGENIVSELINIIDDPMDEKSFFKRSFDDEGVAASKNSVVENGVLKTLLHNRKTAAKAGTQTTGNAQKGSVSSAISVAPSNFILQAGETSFDELCKKLDNGLYITEFSGLHSGANAVSGDFSLLCRGFVVENGKIGQALEQITIADNFLEMMKKVVELGNDSRYGLSSIVTPSILFENMQVAGE